MLILYMETQKLRYETQLSMIALSSFPLRYCEKLKLAGLTSSAMRHRASQACFQYASLCFVIDIYIYINSESGEKTRRNRVAAALLRCGRRRLLERWTAGLHGREPSVSYCLEGVQVILIDRIGYAYTHRPYTASVNNATSDER